MFKTAFLQPWVIQYGWIGLDKKKIPWAEEVNKLIAKHAFHHRTKWSGCGYRQICFKFLKMLRFQKQQKHNVYINYLVYDNDQQGMNFVHSALFEFSEINERTGHHQLWNGWYFVFIVPHTYTKIVGVDWLYSFANFALVCNAFI